MSDVGTPDHIAEETADVADDRIEASGAGDVTQAPTAVKDVVVSEETAIEEQVAEPVTAVAADVDATPAQETATEAAVEEAPAEDAAPAADAASAVTPEDSVTADVGGEDELFEEAPAPRPKSAFDRPGRWYVVHTQSGHEKKAQQNLAARTESMNMEDRIFESVIPMEDVVEFKNGKKVVVQKKMFPGYLLVRAHLDDDAWYVVRNTPSVVNFVGSGGKPSPLLRREVENFLQVKEEGAPATPNKRQTARLEYEMGETCLLYTSPSPRDQRGSRMPSSA